MDFSKHVKNNVTTHYAYYEYELLPENQRVAQKGELQCYGCNAPTKFVRSSKSGSQAYFGLMSGEEHEKKCEKIKKTNDGAEKRRKREEKGYAEAVEKIKNATGEIEIDSTPIALFETLEDKDKVETKNKKLPSRNKKPREKAKTHIISSEQIRASRKNLVQLLKFCLYSSRFLKGSGLRLRFKGRTYHSNERVKPFFQASSITNIKIPYFFYGSIRGTYDNLAFILVGAKKTQVVIDKSIHKQFWNALEVDKYWQLLDAQMICFGWLNRNKDGKSYIKIKDISNIAIIDVKENTKFKPYVTTEPKNMLRPENCTTEIGDRVGANEEYAVIEQHGVSYDKSGSIDEVTENAITHPEGSTGGEDVVVPNDTSYMSTKSDYTKKEPSWLSSIFSFFREK